MSMSSIWSLGSNWVNYEVGIVIGLNMGVMQIFFQIWWIMESSICDHEWFDEIMQRSKLIEAFECVCKKKYWILSEIDHGVVLCILGQAKVT